MSAADGWKSGQAPHRPPAPGPPVHLLEGPAPPSALFLLSYCEESYAFGEGSWGRFGRNDAVVEIPVWEEINGQRLSRVAGEVWCVEGELWARNLSLTHELAIHGPVGPPQWLTRRIALTERGPACSVSGLDARITSPSTGTWELVIESLLVGSAQTMPPSRTFDVRPVPEELRHVAAALCEPLLVRGAPPATYGEVALTLGITPRQARRWVERLCSEYADALLGFSDSTAARYVRLAELLVRRGRVTAADLVFEKKN